jgi:hypothetical protein
VVLHEEKIEPRREAHPKYDPMRYSDGRLSPSVCLQEEIDEFLRKNETSKYNSTAVGPSADEHVISLQEDEHEVELELNQVSDSISKLISDIKSESSQNLVIESPEAPMSQSRSLDNLESSQKSFEKMPAQIRTADDDFDLLKVSDSFSNLLSKIKRDSEITLKDLSKSLP